MDDVGDECLVSTNPDMLGYCVRIASAVTNICLAILIACSPDDVETVVQSLLLLVYPVIIATFLTIRQNELTITDARFAFNITTSPLAIYLVYSAIRDLCGSPNDLFRRLGSTKAIIRILSLLLIVLWLALDALLSFGENLFSGPSCQDVAHPKWLRLLLNNWACSHIKSVSFHNPIVIHTFMFVVAAISWIVYLFRHSQNIGQELGRRRREGGWTRNPITLAFHALRSVWVVVTKEHPWILFIMVLTAFYAWTWYLFSNSPLPVVKPPFGQLLTLFVAVPPVFSIVSLTYRRRREIFPFVKGFPGSFWHGLVFIITGRSKSQRKSSVISLTWPNRQVSSLASESVLDIRGDGPDEGRPIADADDDVCQGGELTTSQLEQEELMGRRSEG